MLAASWDRKIYLEWFLLASFFAGYLGDLALATLATLRSFGAHFLEPWSRRGRLCSFNACKRRFRAFGPEMRSLLERYERGSASPYPANQMLLGGLDPSR